MTSVSSQVVSVIPPKIIFIVDTEVKVWDSETGKNIANLKGHKGSIYSIKMSNDGSYAFSVGTDKFI